MKTDILEWHEGRLAFQLLTEDIRIDSPQPAVSENKIYSWMSAHCTQALQANCDYLYVFFSDKSLTLQPETAPSSYSSCNGFVDSKKKRKRKRKKGNHEGVDGRAYAGTEKNRVKLLNVF